MRVMLTVWLVGLSLAPMARTLAQPLPNQLRVGVSADLVGNLGLGLGAQIQTSYRFGDNPRRSLKYLNVGGGYGVGMTSGLSAGAMIPHYVSFGVGRRHGMMEVGMAGNGFRTTQFRRLPNDPNSMDRNQQWKYRLGPVFGFRYTAESGFLLRVYAFGIIPGVSVGWVY